jgi:hypothetical protein
MDPFSYLVVLTSIILGLGVTRLVGGLGHLMQTRRRKRPYWVHMLWMVNLLLAMAIVWWVAYRWRSNERWTFLLFIWLLLLPTILYLISSLLFPDQDDEPIMGLAGLFLRKSSRHFFALRSHFSDRHCRYASERNGALQSARPTLRADHGAMVRSLPYRRIYQT